ncbi:MAG: four helix bundle protein [Bacteroidetes bacterium]|nr:four helix bundle protein [Bacteroidota bacterium]
MGKKENVIEQKTFQFSLKIILLYKELKKNNEFELGKQLLRSGTSIGANVVEAGAGQSKKDFISKIAISSKEARETLYWLTLLSASNTIKYNFSELIDECEEIIRILTAIVKTSQENLLLENSALKIQH